MKPAKFCCVAVHDTYVVVIDDEWELGMPVGVAHWDGSRWLWIKRIEYGFVTDVAFHEGLLWVLDSGGSIYERDVCAEWHTYDLTNHEILAHFPGGEPQLASGEMHLGYNSMWPLGGDAIGVVGYSGKFFVMQGGNRVWIETGTTATLWAIHGRPPDCFLCGEGGTLLQFDGTRLWSVGPKSEEVFRALDIGFDGTLFVLGTSEHGERVSLWRRENGKDCVWTRHDGPANTHSIAVVSADEVYCATFEHGVQRWNGRTSEQSLPAEVLPGEFGKAGETIMVRSYARDAGAILHSPPDWQRIPLDLDPEFLNHGGEERGHK